MRVIGDTAGGLSGGTFKLLSAPVNGLSSILDAASRGVKAHVSPANAQPPTLSADPARSHDAGGGPAAGSSSASPDDSGEDTAPGATGQTGRSSSQGGDPDPFDRIGSVALTSLAGSLKLLSAAVGGVGDAVFQAGVLAEGLAGGTGQVAEDTVRVVQRFVGWARDDMVKLNNRRGQGGHHDVRKNVDAPGPGKRPPPATPPVGVRTPEPAPHAAEKDGFTPDPALVSDGLSVLEAWEGVRDLGRLAVEALVRQAAGLFRLKNGALPPAPRIAALILLTVFIYDRRRRQRGRHQPPPPPPPPPPSPREPQRSSVARRDLRERGDGNRGPPSTAVAFDLAASLHSPSRSLFSRLRQAAGTPPLRAPGSPWTRRTYEVVPQPDGVDPSLPSPAQERERDRAAWLAWDEGYRRGQASRALDPAAEAETTAWLNHILASAWGGTKRVVPTGFAGVNGIAGGRDVHGCVVTGMLAADGLSSFVAEHLTEGFLEVLEEMKPTSVVGVELLDVELGSSAPQILGITMLDPTSSASPGWGDGRCNHEGECLSFRVDLEVAAPDLRVGVRVKVSSLEKALLPTGTVRLLELFFRGSMSVRAELRPEFPFVKTALIAFDDPPDVQIKLEQWGLDALSLGTVPAAVDEWARMALQQAISPYVMPGFIEVDAASAICPDCPEVPAARKAEKQQQGKAGGIDIRLPSSRLPAATAATFAKGREAAAGGKVSGRNVPGKDRGNRGFGNKNGKNADERKPGKFSGQDSGRFPTAASAFEGDGLVGRGGRAAAMANLYEHRGGMGRVVQWLKDRLTNFVISSNEIPTETEGRHVMDWQGMD
ncbi:hypothetical protein Esi_0003_0313 [Ectocarpus siliculosus]|uniref:SMP-LTD domain-containing protein n=1 Tax=Ectocarpus siliculosus TaxID=2880 RepID=D7FW85_ECTSI|nr:hypothetical protein Esi_0003_0313 [Ectocarpus siliculosus]|eukprot:CBJ25605.1 hypothetical protein Esi_0003_0313 [Ectocarpus siliculosus]